MRAGSKVLIAALATLLIGLATMPRAEARFFFGVGFGYPWFYRPYPVFYRPYAPPPVYVAPQPAVYAPPPAPYGYGYGYNYGYRHRVYYHRHYRRAAYHRSCACYCCK